MPKIRLGPCPIQVGGHRDVSDEMLVGQHLGLHEVQLRLREGAHFLGQRLVLPQCLVFEDVVIQALVLVAVRDSLL